MHAPNPTSNLVIRPVFAPARLLFEQKKYQDALARLTRLLRKKDLQAAYANHLRLRLVARQPVLGAWAHTVPRGRVSARGSRSRLTWALATLL